MKRKETLSYSGEVVVLTDGGEFKLLDVNGVEQKWPVRREGPELEAKSRKMREDWWKEKGCYPSTVWPLPYPERQEG